MVLYCEYYYFHLFQPKRPKDEIIDFILSHKKKKMESFTKGIEQIKINDEYYFSDNLSYELDFLNDTRKKIEEEIFDSKCSFYFGKRTMSMSVELKQITE